MIEKVNIERKFKRLAMKEEIFLNILKATQAEFALEALRRPQERDTFEYGYRVGVVAGYEAAIDILLNLIDEEKYSDNDL